MDYVFRSGDNSYSVVICETTYNKMIFECERCRGLETGGILIGNYSDDNGVAYIRDSFSPIDSRHYKSRFFRGTIGINNILDKKWDVGEYYLGEWHYHPNSSSKSSNLDDNQMMAFSKNKRLNCPNPILVVIGGNSSNWGLNVYVYKNNEKIVLKKE